MALAPSDHLSNALDFLMNEASDSINSFLTRRYPNGELDTFDQLTVMKMLLCVRSPSPQIPKHVLDAIDIALNHEKDQKLLTHSSTIPPLTSCQSPTSNKGNGVRISVWKGDITALGGVTAIVNAANSRMLGCFQPHHKCIDNAIHAAAGPRLRDDCADLMHAQNTEEPVGRAKVTRGYCLPADHVIHTVGPQLEQGKAPNEADIASLKSCYASCLDAVEELPPLPDGRKVLAFCCISTGIFAFPQQLAAMIAVESVKKWIDENPDATITDIIFDVFLDSDLKIYSQLLSPSTSASMAMAPSLVQPNTSLHTAATWLKQADNILISAGAGLSASTGLDYTSTTLFSTHFHGFLKYGFRCFYDLFRPIDWPSDLVKWGYYFHHLRVVDNWPQSDVYGDLLSISRTFEKGNIHVRTSNADGFFIKNMFVEEEMSTPQGRYQYLQCAKPCRKDAFFPSHNFLDAAIPFLDPVSQELTDQSKVPLCKFCGRGLMICVRSGQAFTEFPFREGEQRWREFRKGILSRKKGMTVILELGVGMSTPGVLRWPNEDVVGRGEGRVKLLRIGMEAAGVVDWDMENAVGIKGDVGSVLKALSGVRS